ncbi:response regulator [Salegentibacter sp. F188]|uniref:histidine kinase n=1 Tax=Autumnicola patrickiae TaxID=3075591 RepID=A0ABU3E201_9FLAO|nr:ATP-binding protein [Salegentibacter sp. F188]MDT0690007.1 response regulator [Salegentibacter sp. F188]
MNDPHPNEEIWRIQTLLSYNILDTPYEEDFDGLVQLISIICESPIAIISMIDENRQWYKAKVGIAFNEVQREESFCQHTVLQDGILEIEDAKLDDRVKDNPHVTVSEGIRFYAGAPLKADNGHNIGTVCVVDTKPKKLRPDQRKALQILADQVMSLLEARKKNEELRKELSIVLDRKIEEAEKQLLQKEGEYDNLLKAIKLNNGVIEFSPEGKILKVNKNFLNSIGYSKEELLEKQHSILLNEEQKEDYCNFWQELKKGKSRGGRFMRRHKNGSEVWFQATYNPILDLDDEVIKVIKIAQDITAEINAQKEIQKAKETAESLNVHKDNFIANVSHEIRTPIHAILGFTELLLEQESIEGKLNYLKSIKTAGDNLLFIINDILDLSKIDAGIIEMDYSVFDLKQVVRNVFSILHLKAKQKEIALTYEFQEQVPQYLVGDKNRLTQILINLLGNAIKFTAQGSVKLGIGLQGSTGTKDRGYVEFTVTDTGIGIAEEKLDKIFQRFSQADEAISRKFGGTGLGLNISKQLIEKQDGSIEVSSEIGKGSTFKVVIPYKISENPIAEKSPYSVEGESITRKANILVCEDNELNQKLIKAILSEKGHHVDIASNGNIGLEFLAKNQYDLVFMDIQMPEKDGYETTREIRNTMDLKMPIIALSANFLNSEKVKCLERGMNDYLSKPFGKEELEGLLNRWLGSGGRKLTNAGVNKVRETDDVVFLNNLEEFSGGNEEFKAEMILLFIEQSERMLQDLEKSVEQNDFKSIKSTAHKFKSSFGIIGADTENLNNLEEIQEGEVNQKEVEELLKALKDQLKKIFFILKKINKPQYENPTGGR